MSTPLENWVEESARLTKPTKIVWCDGSQAESDRLAEEMLRDGLYARNAQRRAELAQGLMKKRGLEGMWLNRERIHGPFCLLYASIPC